MSNSPAGSALKDPYPQSGNTVEGYIEEPSYQDYHMKQKQHQQPLPAGIFPQQFHPKDTSLQTSANWVSPKQDDHCSTPQQQLLSAPQHPSNNNCSLPSSQCSVQKPDHQSAGVPIPSGNISFEEFIAIEEQQSSSSIDPKTGFPKTWPEVSSPSPATVTSTPVEQPSTAKFFSQADKEASRSNVPRTFPPPSPPPPRRSCNCCIIL